MNCSPLIFGEFTSCFSLLLKNILEIKQIDADVLHHLELRYLSAPIWIITLMDMSAALYQYSSLTQPKCVLL